MRKKRWDFGEGFSGDLDHPYRLTEKEALKLSMNTSGDLLHAEMDFEPEEHRAAEPESRFELGNFVYIRNTKSGKLLLVVLSNKKLNNSFRITEIVKKNGKVFCILAHTKTQETFEIDQDSLELKKF